MRPKLPQHLKHTNQYPLRLTDSELKAVKLMAKLINKPMSFFIRDCLNFYIDIFKISVKQSIIDKNITEEQFIKELEDELTIVKTLHKFKTTKTKNK